MPRLTMSTRGIANLQYYEENTTHSVILEKTPSPPPKPPRGIMRKQPPIKPQRSAVKIEPAQNDDKENYGQNNKTQFKSTQTMEKMQSYFNRSIAVLRSSSEFTGTEAADIITAYIESHRSDFTQQNLGRSNAVKVLQLWLNENKIKSVESNSTNFVDSERSFYRVGGESEHSLYIASSPAPLKADCSVSIGRSSSSRRANSFKSLFSPLVRRNRSSSRGRDKDGLKDGNSSTVLKSTWSLFSSSDKNEKKARKAEQQMIKEEEAEIYELALFHLLGLIQVEFLEDVALPLQDSKKNASFLSSIMEKVGFGSGEESLEPEQENEMDLLIETHPLIGPARPWFQMARCCAPLLYLQHTPDKSSKMQLYLWCKAALNAVKSRLEKLTRNGASPLFPTEFAPLLQKIAQELMSDLTSEEKLSTAVMYVFLMVPRPLRETIDQIVQWLVLTMRSDAVEDLRSPYYLGQKDPRRYKENVNVIIGELSPFIFPKGCLTNLQQEIFIETLVELRQANRLGQKPAQLENSLRAKHNSAESELTPVRYTVVRESIRSKAAKNEKLSDTDAALVEMMNTIIDDKNLSLTDKKKRLANFQKHYPELYKKYFNGML